MSEYDNGLAKLFPSMSAPPEPTRPATGLASRGVPAPRNEYVSKSEKLVQQAQAEGVAVGLVSDEILADKFYGQPGLTKEAVNSYEPQLNAYFDVRETAARSIGDAEELSVLKEARVATESAFRDMSIHPSTAQQIMTAAHRYADQPKDADTIEKMNVNVMTSLRAQYGRRTEAVVAAAQRVSTELERRIPEFKKLLLTGFGSDPVLINSMISVAKRRGYIS